MSKKNRKFNQPAAAGTASASQSHAAEYRIIRHDLVRLIILNVIVLGAVLTVYYTNQGSHYLENWAAKFLHLS